MVFFTCLSGLLNNCKTRFFYWLKQLGKYYKRLYALIQKLYSVKMSHWYQMNHKGFLYNFSALSAQLPSLAGLSL